MAGEEEVDVNALLAQAQAAANSALNFKDEDAIPMDDTINEEDIQLTAEDMNDPDLLAQLREMEGGSDDANEDINAESGSGDEQMFEEMQTQSITQLKQKIAMVQQKAQQFKSASDTNNFKLSQQCLKELQFLYSQISGMDAISFATDKDEIDLQIKQVYSKISNISVTPHSNKKMSSQHTSKQSMELQNKIDIEVGDTDKECTEQLLLQRYKMYKFAAKKAKDSGDKTTAIQYLKQSKVIAAYVAQIREGVSIWESDIPPLLADEVWNISVRKKVVQKVQKTEAAPVERVMSEEKRELNEMYATPQQIESRIQHYRIACVKAKKDGNISAAKEYLREFKEMQKMLGFVREGKIKPRLGDLPPEIREGHIHINKKASVQSKAPKVVPKPKQRRLSATEQNEYTKIIKKLTVQIEECKSDASFLQSDDKQKGQLLTYARESMVMLQKVRKCQKLQLETPKYELFNIKVKALNVNSEIEENELRLFIGKLSNLATKGSTDIYLTIKCDNLCDITTPTRKVKFSTDFGITKRCKIERNKKLKHRIKFGRLNIALYHKKWMSAVCIGQCQLKLKPLLEQSSLKETVTLTPEESRKKMADLQVEIKLNTPVFSEKAQTVISKQLLKIVHFPQVSQVKKEVSNAKRKVVSAPQQRAVEQKVNVTKQRQSVTPQKPIQQKKVEKSSLPNGLTQEMIDNPLGIEYIESFECISKAIEQCQQEIIQKGGMNCEGIQDRMQGLSTAKTVLEVQVNNGLLTLEEYSARVKKAMITDLALAKYLKTQNRKIEAVKVLQRYKLMKKEIEGS